MSRSSAVPTDPRQPFGIGQPTTCIPSTPQVSNNSWPRCFRAIPLLIDPPGEARHDETPGNRLKYRLVRLDCETSIGNVEMQFICADSRNGGLIRAEQRLCATPGPSQESDDSAALQPPPSRPELEPPIGQSCCKAGAQRSAPVPLPRLHTYLQVTEKSANLDACARSS